MNYYKKVLLPIIVPKGCLCCNKLGDVICDQFSNEGGHPICSFRFRLKYNKETEVFKPEDCNELKEEK